MHVWRVRDLGRWFTMYSVVQCIVDNGHMGPKPAQNDGQTQMKIDLLPSRNFMGGR